MSAPSIFNEVSPAPLGVGSRRWIRDLVPPVKDRHFWMAVLMVVFFVVLHDSADRSGFLKGLGSMYFLTTALFFAPLAYVAWHYRPAAPIATGFWIAVLTIPNWALWHHNWDERLSFLSMLALMTALTAFISRSVNAEKSAWRAAVKSETDLRASELKYRDLFESSPIPVIIAGKDGAIQETNPAANKLLGIEPSTSLTLSGLIGADNATVLLNASQDTERKFEPFSIRRPDGQPIFYTPTLSHRIAGREKVVQVILKDITEEHNRQVNMKAYAAAVTEAREEERRRIARVIHDDSIQPLILLCRQLDRSAVFGQTNDPELIPELSVARKTVEDLVAKLREFITSLRPPALDDFGVVTVIRSLVREYRDRAKMDIELNVAGEYHRLPPDVELGIFRIAQEAVSNAVLHSGASKISVALAFSADEVRLEVVDNGHGFVLPLAHKLISLGHFGIIGMQERADMFGGDFHIESTPGKGTKVTAFVRLQKRSDSR
jgi:PAS domain S-box-containing protein